MILHTHHAWGTPVCLRLDKPGCVAWSLWVCRTSESSASKPLCFSCCRTLSWAPGGREAAICPMGSALAIELGTWASASPPTNVVEHVPGLPRMTLWGTEFRRAGGEQQAPQAPLCKSYRSSPER